MGNSKIVTLIDNNKEIGKAEVICAFKVPNLNSNYIIYTKNEYDQEGNTIIYSGKVINKDKKQFLENINEGEEWETLKKIMKSISKHSLEGEKNV